jgi:hypothetical protein
MLYPNRPKTGTVLTIFGITKSIDNRRAYLRAHACNKWKQVSAEEEQPENQYLPFCNYYFLRLLMTDLGSLRKLPTVRRRQSVVADLPG